MITTDPNSRLFDAHKKCSASWAQNGGDSCFKYQKKELLRFFMIKDSFLNISLMMRQGRGKRPVIKIALKYDPVTKKTSYPRIG